MSAVDTELKFEQTVPRSLAHRRALSEVYVSDTAQAGEDEFLIAIQVPRSHCLWYDRDVPLHDPLAAAEGARQGAFVVVHRYLDVPLGLPFSLQRVELRVPDLEPFRDDEREPLEAVCRLRLADKQSRGDVLVALNFSGELTIGGELASTMGGGLVFLPTEDYDVLRAHQRARKRLDGDGQPVSAEPLDPALVGRRDPRNVAIGEAADGSDGAEPRYPLVVDLSHPAFFDHGQDHVPGPLMVEVYRQAALLTAQRAGAIASPRAAVTACEASFTDFAELDAPSECSARVTGEGGGGAVEVELGLHQFGSQIAQARLELTELPS